MMSDATRFEDLTEKEQLELRQAPQWAGQFREEAAKAETALLVHRLSGAINRVSSREDDPEFPPFNGMAASILGASPASNVQSHASGGDLAGAEGIGSQALRGLNVAARSSIVSASENEALTAWQQQRHRILERSAPWTVVTTPAIRLIKDAEHPYAPKSSGERLVPHSTAFTQTLYLALRHRANAIRDYVRSQHPEWMDEHGEISPYSVLRSNEELSPVQVLERERVIAELSFLRDLKEQGILYLDHVKPDGAFFDFKGADGNFSFVPKNALEWANVGQEQALRWQRVQGRSPNLTHTAGRYDAKNATGKAQVLCLMAAYSGFPMEEGVYQDRSNGTKERRSALFLNTRWASQERLLLLEQLISHYQGAGLTADTQAYRDALIAGGLSESDALTKADTQFQAPAMEGIEQSLAILEKLAEGHSKQPNVDIGDAYISLLDASATDPRTPVVSALGLQRFGLSVDASKINEQVITDFSGIVNGQKPWSLNRGYQPRTFEVMNRVIGDQGYLGLNVHGDALFKKGASLYSKEQETEYMLRQLKHGASEGQRDSEALSAANARIEELRTSLGEMKTRLKRSLSRNDDLEHALAVSEDLYVATNIAALELMADQENLHLPPISQPSKAAAWMAKKGFDVPEHHKLIKGRHGEHSEETPISLKEAYELTNQIDNDNRQVLSDYFGELDSLESPQAAGPSFI
jgi:hypothetical protein